MPRKLQIAANHEGNRLARWPNPHIAYGIGTHFCLGAAHARLIVRTLLRKLCAQLQSITLLETVPHLEVAPPTSATTPGNLSPSASSPPSSPTMDGQE